jgi:cytochrome c oxidase cbb3-type subunit 3
MKMIKTVALALAVLSTSVAMAAEPAAVKPGLFEGPNMALAIIAVIQLFAIMVMAGILRSLARNASYFHKIRKLKESAEAKSALLILLFMGFGSTLSAQTADVSTYPEFARNTNTLVLLGLNVMLLLVFLYLTMLVRNTLGLIMPKPETAAVVAGVEEKPKESKIMSALTDAVPVEREHEVLLDHNYDGIMELDNNLPPWWVWMFNLTILFAVVYLIWFHVLPYSNNQEEQYIAELEQAEADKQAYIAKMGESVDENTVFFLDSEADLLAGKNIYVANCQACHAADGGGGVGPNFTDQYWIHGGSIGDMFKTVKYGVPSKGMISWESQLRPKEMAQVVSYIKSLGGTKALAPKEPQGELYIEKALDAPEIEPAPVDSISSDVDQITANK